jgi:ribosomal protein S18 acetylase RimI-like enzyme
MIRSTTENDRLPIIKMLEKSNEFDSDGIELINTRLFKFLAGDEHSIWLTADADGVTAGVAYSEREPVSDGVWNLLMLWIDHAHQSAGFGSALVNEIQFRLTTRGARLLIVETSGTDPFEPARRFYVKHAFGHEATIRDYYGNENDKIIYTKRLIRSES